MIAKTISLPSGESFNRDRSARTSSRAFRQRIVLRSGNHTARYEMETIIQGSEHYFWDESKREFYHEGENEWVSDSLYVAKVNVFEDRQRAWFLVYCV
jgi:hypothetical protein